MTDRAESTSTRISHVYNELATIGARRARKYQTSALNKPKQMPPTPGTYYRYTRIHTHTHRNRSLPARVYKTNFRGGRVSRSLIVRNFSHNSCNSYRTAAPQITPLIKISNALLSRIPPRKKLNRNREKNLYIPTYRPVSLGCP